MFTVRETNQTSMKYIFPGQKKKSRLSLLQASHRKQDMKISNTLSTLKTENIFAWLYLKTENIFAWLFWSQNLASNSVENSYHHIKENTETIEKI